MYAGAEGRIRSLVPRRGVAEQKDLTRSVLKVTEG